MPGESEDRRRWGYDGSKRQTVEIQVTHVGPDLEFAAAEVAAEERGPTENRIKKAARTRSAAIPEPS